MPTLPVTLLCLWLCSEADASRLHWQKTKATVSAHYESSAAQRNAQSRGWLAVGGEDSVGTRSVSSQASWLDTVNRLSSKAAEIRRRAARKINPHYGAERIRRVPGEEALRTSAVGASEQRRGGSIPGEVLQQTRRGPTCIPADTEHSQRQRRSANPNRPKRSEPLPTAMAQEQEAAPFRVNASDYDEEFALPDFPDTTPFVSVNARTRRRQLKNPFFPVTAEACGAYAVVILAVVLFTVGIIGNVSVMCIVCHNYYMRSISNSLLANLALWDFAIIFFCLPLVVFHELTKHWLLGEFSCRIIPYLEVTSLGVTTFTLCALCIDRFRAATNVQMYYEMIENWASTTAKLAVIWLGALLLALPELLIRQLVTEEGDPPGVTPCERCVIRISTELPDTLYVLGLTYDGARLWWYFGCYFCLPTLFTICSSLLTARRIRHAERSSVRGSNKQIKLENQMNCVVVVLAILYGFCIIPENICNILSTYMEASVPRKVLDILHLVSQLLLFCKSAAAPVLLFCLCQPFTKAFLDCCCCCCEECGPPQSPAADADNDVMTAELELSPFGDICEEASTSAAYTAVGTHC